MGVLDLQGIEGPLHQLKATDYRVVTLGQLQTASQAVIAPAVAHGQHVRVQVRAPAALAGNGESKAYEFVILAGVEGADDLPSDLVADHEHAQRDHVNVVK